MPRSTTRENNGKCLEKQRVHSTFSSVGKLPANVMFTRVHLQHNKVRKPPTNTDFTNSGKQRKTIYKNSVFPRGFRAQENCWRISCFPRVNLRYNTVRKPRTNGALNHSGNQQKTLQERVHWSFSRAGKLRANVMFSLC